MAEPHRPPTPRTQVRRIPQRAAYDEATLHAILDEGIVCHVGLVQDGAPFVMPTGYVRDGDRLLLHGATSSRLMRALASGQPVCVTVTLVDGIVVSRSAFHHSMNYRSAVVFGAGRAITDPAAKREAFRIYMDRLVPGRWDEARQPNAKEELATMVVEVPLAEVSCKLRQGPPGDEPEDLAFPAWSGVIPLRLATSPPVQDPTQAPAAPPAHVAGWRPEARSGPRGLHQ